MSQQQFADEEPTKLSRSVDTLVATNNDETSKIRALKLAAGKQTLDRGLAGFGLRRSGGGRHHTGDDRARSHRGSGLGDTLVPALRIHNKGAKIKELQ